MKMYKILWTSLSSDIMHTYHTEKNTDQQSLLLKELQANARQEKGVQVQIKMQLQLLHEKGQI